VLLETGDGLLCAARTGPDGGRGDTASPAG
jgi:hypothetical protein